MLVNLLRYIIEAAEQEDLVVSYTVCKRDQ